MKKIHLSITEPCHEKWNEMTPCEKGKFCNSCQKTVIDFSNMNDRQLAEFFKKPVSNICGHLHSDQLDREIPLNRKRIPWLRYFFQFTWPAMVLMLKSCGMKQSVKGVVIDSHIMQYERDRELVYTDGYVVGDTIAIQQIDTLRESDSFEIGKTTVTSNRKNFSDKIETRINQKVMEDENTINKRLDVQKASQYEPVSMQLNGLTGITGGLVACIRVERSSRTEEKKIIPTQTDQKNVTLNVFPNPVNAGGLLTISCKDEEGLPARMQIINSSGQLVMATENESDGESRVLHVRIPNILTAGVYFLRLIGRDENVVTKKFVVM
ncbi:MAG: T9SS type A sorting domain-containing protein [Flavisolibacter sp.]